MADLKIPRALIEQAVRDIVAEALVAERERADRMAEALYAVERMTDDGHPNDPDWFRILTGLGIPGLLAEHDAARPSGG